MHRSARMQSNRRTFLGGAGALVLASTANAMGTRPALRRIGFSSVSIRNLLPFRLPGAPPPAKAAMSLLDAPAFAATKVGLRNLEVWNLQFEDTSDDYCRRLRDAAARAKVRITNVQVDGRMDLGSPDADERARSVAEARQWLDRTALIGARSMRVNFSAMAPKTPFAVGPAAQSLRELAIYGKSRGVMVLTENHIGHSVQIANLTALLKNVSHPNFRTIFDWGNVPDPTTERVIEALHAVSPWLYLTSAKGVAFDAQYHMTSYDVGAITRATEKTGFGGLYSIELFGPTPPGFDPLAAIRSMERTIVPLLRT